MLNALGIYIKSHDFAFRVDRVDLGIAARARRVNRREVAFPAPHEAVKALVIKINSYDRAGVVDSFRDRKNCPGHINWREVAIFNYVTHLRISNGLRLLKESSLTVTEIAAEVGFADQSYFSRRFKAAFGQTPGQVRANREKRQVRPRKRLHPSTGLAALKVNLTSPS